MSKRRKRLERLRQNPNNVSLNDLRTVLVEYGFEFQRAAGSHHTFHYQIGGETKLLVIPFRRPLKPIYVRRAVELIDRIIAESGDDDESDD